MKKTQTATVHRCVCVTFPSHVRGVEAPQNGWEREMPLLWGLSGFINPNRNSQWQTLKGKTRHSPPFRRRRASRHGGSFSLGGLLKIITTTKVNNETLVSFSDWSGIYPHPRRRGKWKPAVWPPGSFLSPVGPPKHLSETAMIKWGINCWRGPWSAGRSGDPLQAEPRAICVVFFFPQDQQRTRRRYQEPQLQISPHGDQHDRGSLRKLHVRGHQQAGNGQRQRLAHQWVFGNFRPMGAMHSHSAESAIVESSAHFQVFFSFFCSICCKLSWCTIRLKSVSSSPIDACI